MRLSVQAEGPAIDLDRFVRAIPLLVERARTVQFGEDGRAVLDDEPSDRLMLVDGIAGRPGAAYRMIGDDGEQNRVTITRDDAEAIDAELATAPATAPATSTGAAQGTPAGPVGAGTITLERPAEVARVLVAGGLTVAEMPQFIGSQWDLVGQARLADWEAPGEPQVSVQLNGRIGSAHSTARIDRVPGGLGPIGAEKDLWQVALEIELRPRGLARLAALALPFVRRRFSDALAEQITTALVETAAQIAEDFDPEDGPAEIADRAWELIVADLTTPVGEDQSR